MADVLFTTAKRSGYSSGAPLTPAPPPLRSEHRTPRAPRADVQMLPPSVGYPHVMQVLKRAQEDGAPRDGADFFDLPTRTLLPLVMPTHVPKDAPVTALDSPYSDDDTESTTSSDADFLQNLGHVALPPSVARAHRGTDAEPIGTVGTHWAGSPARLALSQRGSASAVLRDAPVQFPRAASR
eukprot:TRINITY_DN5972_c0_g1_i1.p2 TRINITY_DN5972_c0_g1~~TRINITY_DN5972_c0_g1_i1.p2  ORF type:complete len:182 (+),score=48.38 TRINITY_DN5972_c0_g1_i1:113-658(+)